MKKYNLFFFGVILLASCSTPKYTYYFDHYDYNAKKKSNPTPVTEPKEQLASVPQSVITIDETSLNPEAKEPVAAEVVVTESKKESIEEIVARVKSMSKEERKELKKEVKRYVKENRYELRAGKALENDVKLAAIFGAIGIVLLIIGGDVIYVLGAIALIIGLYFFIRWLVRQ